MKVLGMILIILSVLAAVSGIITGAAFSGGIPGMIGYFGGAALFIYLGNKLMKK